MNTNNRANEIEVGQIWRDRRSGHLKRVVQVTHGLRGKVRLKPVEAGKGLPSKTGPLYLRRCYKLVPASTA